MQLVTEVNLVPSPHKFTYQKQSVFIGSCFADSIGSYFNERKFLSLVNPFGVLYNPVSVANALYLALGVKQVEEVDLLQHNGLWHSFYHHSSFSAIDKTTLLENIHRTNTELLTTLKNTDFLFVTFGTAWVYHYAPTDKVVSNNHKLPAKAFRRRRLSVDEIVGEWTKVQQLLHRLNPKLKIVFTLSPVRHLKDGAHENQISKAVLLLALDVLQAQQGNSYFPSYEIVLDELRDYRFYAEDLTHPSKIAIEYIANAFVEQWFDADTTKQMKLVQNLIKAANHKPFNVATKEHQTFIRTTLLKMERLVNEIPTLNFNNEMALLKNQLICSDD